MVICARDVLKSGTISSMGGGTWIRICEWRSH